MDHSKQRDDPFCSTATMRARIKKQIAQKTRRKAMYDYVSNDDTLDEDDQLDAVFATARMQNDIHALQAMLKTLQSVQFAGDDNDSSDSD